jgi:hypothetical protein
MQRFTNNTFSIRRNRFKETGSKFESVSISKVDVGSSFNSINYSEQFYTNYVNTSEQKVYKIMNTLYDKIKDNNLVFNDYFFDELYYKEKTIDRLLMIINESNNETYKKKDLPIIYKLKHNKEPKIHLYISIKNNIVKILLIDLYHLSIPADLYSNGKLTKRITLNDLPTLYNKVSNYNYNLNNILKTS